MITTRERLIQTNQVIVDQADFFEVDVFTRVTALVPGDLVMSLFYNNEKQAWALLDGATVTDGEVRSGSVYWHEISGSPGFYSVRFRPNVAGYWRLVLAYTAGSQIVALGYDVGQFSLAESGLRTSFTGSC